jgi:flagellar basal body rod protein FlgG
MPDSIEQISASVDALLQDFDIIAHNLANVSTAGYKRRCSVFTETLKAQQAGAEQTEGAVTSEAAFDFSQGHIVETGRPLDFALFGKGFFVIETPEGPLYTRNGTFHINQNSQIVNSDGKIVAGQAGPITVPTTIGPSQLNVTGDGSISAAGTAIGKFRLVDFADNQGKLVPAGSSCYRPALSQVEGMPEDIQPIAAENVVVKQGYQEASNVQMTDELVNMIIVSRLYEANMKFITAQKEASSSILSVATG